MSDTTYLVIAGSAVLIGKQPDGDSVRFRPQDRRLLGTLEHGDRVQVSADGTVQLRFDGIDAPELHYEGAAQPRGAAARDALLSHLGFRQVRYAEDGETVTAASPSTVPMVVLARLVEVNGRPVSIVFAGDAAEDLTSSSGTRVEVDADLLSRSVDVWETQQGVTYPLVYTSTAPELREVFVAAGRAARSAGLGVWAADSTASFSVASAAAVGPNGALIWPKLFRRVTDYLKHRTSGQTLPAWLAATPTEDDDVFVSASDADSGTAPTPLHELLTQTGDEVRLVPDVLDLVVVER